MTPGPGAEGHNAAYKSAGFRSSLAAQIMSGNFKADVVSAGGNRMARSMAAGSTKNANGDASSSLGSDEARNATLAHMINGGSSNMMGGSRSHDRDEDGEHSDVIAPSSRPTKRARRADEEKEVLLQSNEVPQLRLDLDRYKYAPGNRGPASGPSSTGPSARRSRKTSNFNSDDDSMSEGDAPANGGGAPGRKRRFRLGNSAPSIRAMASSDDSQSRPRPQPPSKSPAPQAQKATKAQRLNTLYPGFTLPFVTSLLASHSESVTKTMDALNELVQASPLPAIDTLSADHQKLLMKYMSIFPEIKSDGVQRALENFDWDEERVGEHLDMMCQIRTMGTYAPRVKVQPKPLNSIEEGSNGTTKLESPSHPLSSIESSSRSLVLSSSQQGAYGASSTGARSPAPAVARASLKEERSPAPVFNLNGATQGKPQGSTDADVIVIESSPPQQQQKSRRPVEDDETDLSDAASEAASQDREDMQAAAALKWFNTSDMPALMDTINCSEAQAKMLIIMRPFASVDDVNERLGDKKVKGVTPKLFNNCVELMAGYSEVDEVLERCERIGKKLMSEMSAWNLDGAHTAGSTRENTPSSDAGDGDAATAAGSGATSGPSTKGQGLRVVALTRETARAAGYLERQPENMATSFELKDYQLVGVNWLTMLFSNKLSAILADEMGLGKTVQVIAFLANLKLRDVPGPHLIVVPSSVLENWKREFKAFAPCVRLFSYWGSMKEREALRYDYEDQVQDEGVDVVLTTYDMAAGGGSSGYLDAKFFKKRGFNACVFDEGHLLKNRKSERYQKLMKIPAKWRLLLTGTPLQNNLGELVSLLNFIMPSYFRDADEALKAIFKIKPGQSHKNMLSQQRVIRAKKMMQPFVLRRKKDKVLRDLSNKHEIVEWCDMTPDQERVYKQVWASTKAAVQEGEEQNASKAKSKTGRTLSKKPASSNVLMDLRKAANHPLLFRNIYDEKKIERLAKDYVKEPDHADENLEHVKEDFAINSDAQLSMVANSYPFTRKHVLPDEAWLNAGKIQALQRLIPKIKERGDRLLIFSQFTTVLDILTIALDVMKVSWVGFTGQTRVEDRQILVDQFSNDPSITCFLLSTKAGGLGINLTAANWVVLFDQDFNPQNDKQAMDRCYRMGQKKDVTVVRLISRGTIDQSIWELGTRKLELANRVSDDTAGGEQRGKAAGSAGAGDDDRDSAAEDWEEEADDMVQQQITHSLMAELRDKDAKKELEQLQGASEAKKIAT
ncbi:hypothetical protein K437DRAFT_259406 [Tilletiaria anomala UBC 951]|uniref:DNA helicase n=1 Tax=Tilletiaria anomala (strain ATCC 24038 / CBS 436.72 / UBC 951) TaxID=1037660 RepID=A0A066V9P8_TILAU|nr:uncharacterized protein K437DRAFT_259406 [Tilletiaria anomala UBC 951]KDN38457.1 hypothetical protein K437DRAFT_259406 [Tilletiaria anomala UBC 951]